MIGFLDNEINRGVLEPQTFLKKFKNDNIPLCKTDKICQDYVDENKSIFSDSVFKRLGETN